jgi:hypothetical protein
MPEILRCTSPSSHPCTQRKPASGGAFRFKIDLLNGKKSFQQDGTAKI